MSGDYLITDQARQVLYGIVQNARSADDAALRYAADPAERGGILFCPQQPDPQQRLAFVPAGQLTDGRWREVMPGEPMVAGDVGGEAQASEAYCRRFAMRLADGMWAVVTHTYYVAREPGGHPHHTRYLVRDEEFLQCRDLRDPGGTEVWSNRGADPLTHLDAYRFGEDGFGLAAHEACESESHADLVTWDGSY